MSYKEGEAREIVRQPAPPKLRASAAICAFICPGRSCLAEAFFCSLFKRFLLGLQRQGGMSFEVCLTTRSISLTQWFATGIISRSHIVSGS